MGSLGRENWPSLLVSGLGTWPERNKRMCSCSACKRVSRCWLRVRHSEGPAQHTRGIHQTSSSRPQALPGAALACACYERLHQREICQGAEPHRPPTLISGSPSLGASPGSSSLGVSMLGSSTCTVHHAGVGRMNKAGRGRITCLPAGTRKHGHGSASVQPRSSNAALPRPAMRLFLLRMLGAPPLAG